MRISLRVVFPVYRYPLLYGDPKIGQKKPRPEEVAQDWVERDCTMTPRPVQIELSCEYSENIRRHQNDNESLG